MAGMVPSEKRAMMAVMGGLDADVRGETEHEFFVQCAVVEG